MAIKLERRYEFLKNKYNELLLPTIFMVASEEICSLIDVIIISFLIGSTQLAIINLIAPMNHITLIFYILLGQGSNLLILRAQSQLKNEKANYYFTFSIFGIIVVSLLYIVILFLFADNILLLFNTPAEVFSLAREYLLTIMFFYPLNCYILVISYFARSDGFPKLPFYTVLIANILNIFFDIVFLSIFHMGFVSTALASVLGYLVGAIYISQYIFNKKCSFRIISLGKFKLKKIPLSIKEIILNTPEVIGCIFFVLKMGLLTYLCSHYWNVAGLLAFLIYECSETLVYVFLSGVMKAMSPIITVFHKEMDFEAVHYIIVRSLKHILLISVPNKCNIVYMS